MKRILVIDDDPAIIEALGGAIREAFPGVDCSFVDDFDQAIPRIRQDRPDAVVLDLRADTDPGAALPGEQTWHQVWNTRFCPIVIYTAMGGELSPPLPVAHPLAKRVTKGQGSEVTVIGHLRDFVPFVRAIDKLREEIESVIHQVLRETFDAGVFAGADEAQILHAGRRRIAASMDEQTSTTQSPMKSWEHYLIPPMGISPLTGDVLRRRDADVSDSAAYRLILSPSCDMVRDQSPCPVLVARCEDVTEVLPRRLQLDLNSAPAKRERSTKELVSRVLSQGVWNGWLPLPEFPGHIPMLAANLKNLEVVPFDSICPPEGQQPEFNRVASIDSPFREQVAWAVLSTLARPGMPDRDLTEWAGAWLEKAAAHVAAQTQNPA